jgi:Ca-activated chloride channel homolog
MLAFNRFSPHRMSVPIWRSLRSTILLTLLIPCSGRSLLLSQAYPATVQQAQSNMSLIMFDPTHPEVQRSLDADRDPVLSPDPEESAPVDSAIPEATGKANGLQKKQDGLYTMRTDVEEVLQYCTVVDEKGRLVDDLGRGDFRIWEDDIPQTMNSFQHQDVPVSIGILVDNSGSMRDKRAAVNSAALNLIRASNPQDMAFIVNFSDRAFLDQGFTSEIAALDRGLSHFDSKGLTALYDAVAASADELANHGKNPKQALLIITDGADNASRLSLEQAISRVQKLGGPVVYSIGLLFGVDKEESQRAKNALEMLSRETGGIAYFPHSLEDVDTIAAEVARDIRSQYTIGYHSSNPSSLGNYRVVRVETNPSKHRKLIVRTRRGYYAKKPTTQMKTEQEAKK